MVKQVSQVMALSNSGLSDWVVQRATAVILTAYFTWVMAFFLLTPSIDYAVLTGFFASPAMKIAGTLAVLSTVAHAWIGLWTIGTDYCVLLTSGNTPPQSGLHIRRGAFWCYLFTSSGPCA